MVDAGSDLAAAACRTSVMCAHYLTISHVGYLSLVHSALDIDDGWFFFSNMAALFNAKYNFPIGQVLEMGVVFVWKDDASAQRSKGSKYQPSWCRGVISGFLCDIG